ncbi:MAG: 23S rRNA (uracil(1939)-C(5))-methyltransferase RlmD [Faecalibacterium sp.]
MPLRKNQIIPLSIDTLSSDGNGVGHYQGEAVFVPASAPGDILQVRIVKDCKRYAFGIIDKITTPSPDRLPLDCSIAGPCGGCCYRHLSYQAECAAKEQVVADAFARIGNFTLPVLPILPSPEADRYRNKVQFPVSKDDQGHIVTGFYANRSHRVVPCTDCKLQPTLLNQIANNLAALLETHTIPPYDEETHSGLVRHLFLRRGTHSNQIMLCIVCNGATLPHCDTIIAALLHKFPDIASILLNVNTEKTNLILGKENIVLYGKSYIEDHISGVPVQLSALSFYQVNTLAAEQLYAVAADFATLQSSDTLLDLYCGMGTIGLSMASQCDNLIGVEVVAEAIESAKKNAAQMGINNARFLCADAGKAATQLASDGLQPDVIVIDPPRKGCDAPTLKALCTMSPRRIVMVSCNPATAARDAKYLAAHGYTLTRIQPADFFPRTKHVECVCLLEKAKELSNV